MDGAPAPLPPTRADLLDPSARPYFLWWADVTVGEFRRALAEGTDDERAYWMGALLREANTRDVWVYVTPDEVRAVAFARASPRPLARDVGMAVGDA